MDTVSAQTGTRAPRILSYGGGLDSFAVLLKAIALGELPDVAVFCDVGDGAADRDGTDPGEWPSTYRHIREVVLPLCAAHGIEFVWLTSEMYPVRDARSLFAWFQARGQIPTASGRTCTIHAKVERFERWAADRFGVGAAIEVWVGFEAGEEDRAAKDPNAGGESRKGGVVRRNRFPLIEWGMCRCRCEAFVREAGYPVPRKSACTFCPFGSKGDWQTLARELPATFATIAKLEADKPLTGPGKKLSIMGFRTFKNGAPKRTKLTILRDHAGVAYSAPPVTEFVKGDYKPEGEPCAVCGAAQRATKATGCSYLSDPAEAAAE